MNVYGRTKAAAEDRVLEVCPEALVIRTSAFFGPWDKFNFAYSLLNDLADGRIIVAANDITISPTYVPDLVNATLDLLIDDEQGIWHLANTGIVTWAEFARLVAGMAGFRSEKIEGRPEAMLGHVAPRPSFTPLSSERSSLMPSLEDSLDRFFHECKWERRMAASGRQ